MGDIEEGFGIEEESSNPNTLYLLFKQWYVTAIEKHLQHAISSSHFGFQRKAFRYSLIFLTAISMFINGLSLIFTQLDISEAVTASIVLVLLIECVSFVVSGINGYQDFGELSKQHQTSSDDYKKLSEDIIKLFTPLSHEEAEINLAYERNYVQRVLKFLIDSSPGVPDGIVNKFNKDKNKSNEYKNHMLVFESIQSDANLLFSPVHNAIVNNAMKMNDDLLFDDVSDDFNTIPEIQQLYNESNKK